MPQSMVELDGTGPAGSGRVLRTALALALITGKPFRLFNVRAAERVRGFAAEDFAAMRAAAIIGQGEMLDAAVGEEVVAFRPGKVQAGNYRFDIGSEGAVAPLLPILMWPLVRQAHPSTLTLIGNTHAEGAPTFESLSLCWGPLLRRLGLRISLYMPKAGFSPGGGGALQVSLRGGAVIQGVRWGTPVVFDAFTGLSVHAGLGEEVAERLAAGARDILEAAGIYCPMATAALTSPRPGSAITLVAGSKSAPMCATVLGAHGRTPEETGQMAAQKLVRWVQARAAIDPETATDLLLPLALATAPSAFLTTGPTDTLQALAGVIDQFLPTRIAVEPDVQGRCLVLVEPGA